MSKIKTNKVYMKKAEMLYTDYNKKGLEGKLFYTKEELEYINFYEKYVNSEIDVEILEGNKKEYNKYIKENRAEHIQDKLYVYVDKELNEKISKVIDKAEKNKKLTVKELTLIDLYTGVDGILAGKSTTSSILKDDNYIISEYEEGKTYLIILEQTKEKDYYFLVESDYFYKELYYNHYYLHIKECVDNNFEYGVKTVYGLNNIEYKEETEETKESKEDMFNHYNENIFTYVSDDYDKDVALVCEESSLEIDGKVYDMHFIIRCNEYRTLYSDCSKLITVCSHICLDSLKDKLKELNKDLYEGLYNYGIKDIEELVYINKQNKEETEEVEEIVEEVEEIVEEVEEIVEEVEEIVEEEIVEEIDDIDVIEITNEYGITTYILNHTDDNITINEILSDDGEIYYIFEHKNYTSTEDIDRHISYSIEEYLSELSFYDEYRNKLYSLDINTIKDGVYKRIKDVIFNIHNLSIIDCITKEHIDGLLI